RHIRNDAAEAIIPPDIIKTQDILDDENIDHNEDEDEDLKPSRKTHVEQALNYDPHVVLEQFSKLNYIERYINANFQYATCY
ncbi:unnamed protein product, partial [Rotaria magnacalcarata]